MTVTSFLIPLGGLITAPLLAQGLGAEGRGELAAVLAPATLVLGVATLGLPDALTFHLAKRPSITRHALAWASAATVALGVLSVLAVRWASPLLSAHDSTLAGLMVLAATWNIAALLVGVLRGAATGRQLWGVVAWERILLTVTRIGALAVLLAMDRLTVETATLVSVVVPVVAGVVYMGLLARPPQDQDQPVDDPRIVAPLFVYGGGVWLGSVASMAIARLASILMLPLSNAEALGLFMVAVTIADVPLIVAMAIQGTLFGVSSRDSDPRRVTDTSRLTLIVGSAGCLVMGASLPWWLTPVFGEDFASAVTTAWILLGSAVVLIPGLMASGGLSAWGRPALRSIGLVLSLLVQLGLFLWLVPRYGAEGAAWSGAGGTVVLTLFSVIAAARVVQVRIRDFVLPRRGDIGRVGREVRHACVSLLRRDHR